MTRYWATWWDAIRTSLWLLPSGMISGGLALAVLTLWIDAGLGTEDHVQSWFSAGDGEDARNLISTLLTATITMASMAFSVTVVALTLAANTYGSRLIRIFRADLRTQFVLGLFAMTIVYCLLVLRTVHGKAPVEEVPHISVTVGTALAFVSVLALLGFIQSVARSLVAEEVVSRVRRDLEHGLSELPRITDGFDARDSAPDLPTDFGSRAERIPLPPEGYVQAIEYRGLLAWAERNDAVLRLDFRPGDFVVGGDRRVLLDAPG
jgi:uncharacterized membrane protein